MLEDVGHVCCGFGVWSELPYSSLPISSVVDTAHDAEPPLFVRQSDGFTRGDASLPATIEKPTDPQQRDVAAP